MLHSRFDRATETETAWSLHFNFNAGCSVLQNVNAQKIPVVTMELFIKNLKVALLKFMFSRKATKIDKILTVDLTLCSKRQMDGDCQFSWPS